ncbi:MAG: tetratricopeptide repeat protein, partial [Nitrospinales bacterium]
RYKEALEVYSIATQYNPNYGLAYYDMGVALMSMNNLEKSLRYFLRAKNLEPDLVFPKEVKASLGFDKRE